MSMARRIAAATAKRSSSVKLIVGMALPAARNIQIAGKFKHGVCLSPIGWVSKEANYGNPTAVVTTPSVLCNK